jgi:hypothetical protein
MKGILPLVVKFTALEEPERKWAVISELVLLWFLMLIIVALSAESLMLLMSEKFPQVPSWLVKGFWMATPQVMVFHLHTIYTPYSTDQDSEERTGLADGRTKPDSHGEGGQE